MAVKKRRRRIFFGKLSIVSIMGITIIIISLARSTEWAGTYSFGKYEKDSQNPVYKISLRASLIGHVLPSLVLGQVGRFYSELVRIRALGEVWQTTFLFFSFFPRLCERPPFTRSIESGVDLELGKKILSLPLISIDNVIIRVEN